MNGNAPDDHASFESHGQGDVPTVLDAVVAFRSNALFVAGTTFDAFALAVIAILALVAYGRLMPVTTAAE